MDEDRDIYWNGDTKKRDADTSSVRHLNRDHHHHDGDEEHDHAEHDHEKKENDKEEEKEKEKEEEETMKGKVTDLVTECGGRSSFHGFPSLASDKVPRFIKIIWIVCCLGSWSYFVYQIVNTVNTYNQYSVVSSVSVGYEAPSTFPGIYISIFSHLFVI